MYKTLLAILIIIMMCGIASADVETGLPYGYRNFAPDETYTFIDFNDGKYNMIPFNGLLDTESIKFVDYLGTYNFIGHDEPEDRLNVWGWADAAHNLMHVYPNDFYYNPDGSQVDHIFLIEGESAGCPTMLWGWEWYPSPDGVILLPNGADHISFIVSTGGNFRATTYDAKGNFIERLSTGSNIARVYLPDGPSTWTRFSFDSSKSDIYKIHLSGVSNGWHIDDLVIGGLPLLEEVIDYSWAAERLKLLVGAPHNPNGFGYEFLSGTFYPAEDIVNNPLVVNWDYENKEWTTGEGINNEGAIIFAFNKDANIINNLCINDMASKDFKVLVEYGDQKPGDVAFIEYDTGDTSEGAIGYDEIIVFIEPQVDSNTGMVEDCIRVSEEDGVHYSDSKFLHDLYGTTIGPEITSLFTVKSMPKEPKGNKKSPYPKIPGKFI